MQEDTSRTLLAHREALARNERAYEQDLDPLDRLADTAVVHLRNCGLGRVTMIRCGRLVRQFVEMVFESQGRKPFFHVPGTLPFCWNRVKDWDKNYIHYEWGHLRSRNENAQEAHHVEHLCLQSARCNQHIQAALNIEDVEEWLAGSAVATRVRDVRERRAALFASEPWRALLHELEAYRTVGTGT